VKLRKFLALLFVIVLVSLSVPLFATYMCDFEQPIEDTLFPLNPWAQYRDLEKRPKGGAVSVVENEKWFSLFGHHAAEIHLDTMDTSGF
jgi:hypothetical protein